MSPSKARAKVFERTPTTNDIFYSGRMQNEHERPDLEQKYMNTDKAQCKEPELEP